MCILPRLKNFLASLPLFSAYYINKIIHCNKDNKFSRLILINSSTLNQGLYSAASIRSIQKNNPTFSSIFPSATFSRLFNSPVRGLCNTGKRRYYSSSYKKDDSNFFEWLCGITDGEGSFGIGSRKSSKGINFSFTYVISLHVDDTSLLEFIQKRLGLGKVYTHFKKSYFIVKNKKDVKTIIDIFTQYPLKTHKNLNFLDFKKAFHLYTETIDLGNRIEQLKEIETIKAGMNTLRSEFYNLKASLLLLIDCLALLRVKVHFLSLKEIILD